MKSLNPSWTKILRLTIISTFSFLFYFTLSNHPQIIRTFEAFDKHSISPKRVGGGLFLHVFVYFFLALGIIYSVALIISLVLRFKNEHRTTS